MTTWKYICLVLGIAFLTLDIVTTYLIIIGQIDIRRSFDNDREYFDFIWSIQILLIPGLLFLFGAYRIQKRINYKNKLALENAFAD